MTAIPPGARRDKYKTTDHVPHWSPAVCEVIARERAAATNELRAAIETQADEWECPPYYREGDAGDFHRAHCHGCKAGATLRALLDEVAP